MAAGVVSTEASRTPAGKVSRRTYDAETEVVRTEQTGAGVRRPSLEALRFRFLKLCAG